MISKRNIYTFLFYLFILLVCGCNTSSLQKEPQNKQIKREGFYHKVTDKETLSQISRKYNVNVEKLAELNHIPNKNNIAQGQLIFIPTDFKNIESKKIIIKPKVNFIWPAKGKIVSLFSNQKGNINQGIDIEVSSDSMILAVKNGKVTFSGGEDIKIGSGDERIVILQHNDNFSSVYIYEGILLVKRYDEVKQGQGIFKANQDGGNKILHFEIRKHHIPQNPYYFLP